MEDSRQKTIMMMEGGGGVSMYADATNVLGKDCWQTKKFWERGKIWSHSCTEIANKRQTEKEREGEKEREREKRKRERLSQSTFVEACFSLLSPSPFQLHTRAPENNGQRERERERDRYAKTGSFNWPLQVVSPLCSYVCARE